MLATIPQNIITAAEDTMREYLVPASVSIAQWIVESGWGAHSPGNNPFGMKPRQGMNDPSQMLLTTEVIGGKSVKVMQPFRTFPTIEAAFEAHGLLLSTAPVYHQAMSFLTPNACPTEEAIHNFIIAMASHYATDPLYASKLINEISAQQLQRFDLQ